MSGYLVDQIANDLLSECSQVVIAGYDISVLLGCVDAHLTLLLLKDDTLEEGHDLFDGEVIGQLGQLMQQIYVLVQDNIRGRLKDLIDEVLHLHPLVDMRYFLEQCVERYACLIVSLLRHL